LNEKYFQIKIKPAARSKKPEAGSRKPVANDNFNYK